MEDSQLKELIMQKQSGGRISCKAACDISDETGVSCRDIGRLIDELHIKIHSCQLGCFK
jgi:hypothetical protein